MEKGSLHTLGEAIDYEHIPRDWVFVVHPKDFYLFRKDAFSLYLLFGSLIFTSEKIERGQFIWMTEGEYWADYADNSKPQYL